MKRLIKADNQIDWSLYDEEQKEVIEEGIAEGLDVSWYTNPQFTAGQMYWIQYGLEEGLDVSQYADPSISSTQMNNIVFKQMLDNNTK